jgi:protein tyrosine phosphatase
VKWVREQEGNLHGGNVAAKAKALTKGIGTSMVNDAEGMGHLLSMALSHVHDFKDTDPLHTWFHSKSENTDRIMIRFRKFVSRVCATIKWSFLIEPGRPRIDLSNFIGEYEILDDFFENTELNAEERSQKTFEVNYMMKARDKAVVCADYSRVVLTVPEEITEDSRNGSNLPQRRRVQPSDIFGDIDCPQLPPRADYGTGDFIHANYVLGGPLLNNFILTQAPLPETVPDFWRMIWQEKCEYIFMLCEALDPDGLGLLGESVPAYCPYYWPRYQGEVRRFGRLVVKNEKLETVLDPLFNVTRLAIWIEDDPTEVLRVEHWQYDWRDYTDVHWPLRLLRRSRQSKKPTVIHCMDGCGRSGTLVLIEVMLMQLLRGTTNFQNPMLTAAIFIRLQRRHAIANHMQYLYAYRTVLHYIEPYVLSNFQRFLLGYLYSNTGFIRKYQKMALTYSRRNNNSLILTKTS